MSVLEICPAANPSFTPMLKASGLRPVSSRSRTSVTSAHTAIARRHSFVDAADVFARDDKRVAVRDGIDIGERKGVLVVDPFAIGVQRAERARSMYRLSNSIRLHVDSTCSENRSLPMQQGH